MLRLYAIVFTVLALFTGTATYVAAYIGIRSATVVVVVGWLTTLLTVALVSLEITPKEEADKPSERPEGGRAEVGLGLRHAHEPQ
jgi:uncharacterized PurR-regulated membrane protein YhhQ (DUF165 family)